MKKLLVFGILIFSINSFADSSPYSFTYQGKLMNAAGTAPLSATIGLKLDILDPSGKCLIYSETQSSIDLTQTNGLFAVFVGTPIGDAKRTAGEPGLAMTQVFANAGTQLVAAAGACPGYTPAPGDGRLLHVSVINGGSTTVITPDLPINSVPNSLVSETLQGQTPAYLMPPGSVINYAGATCPAGFLTADGASYTIASYPALSNSLKSGATYLWGAVDGTHFNVPDFRGSFLRGIDNMGTTKGAAGRDLDGTSRVVGSYQADQFASHSHGVDRSNNPGPANFAPGSNGYLNGGSTGSAGGTETRPKNFGVMFCVKY